MASPAKAVKVMDDGPKAVKVMDDGPKEGKVIDDGAHHCSVCEDAAAPSASSSKQKAARTHAQMATLTLLVFAYPLYAAKPPFPTLPVYSLLIMDSAFSAVRGVEPLVMFLLSVVQWFFKQLKIVGQAITATKAPADPQLPRTRALVVTLVLLVLSFPLAATNPPFPCLTLYGLLVMDSALAATRDFEPFALHLLSAVKGFVAMLLHSEHPSATTTSPPVATAKKVEVYAATEKTKEELEKEGVPNVEGVPPTYEFFHWLGWSPSPCSASSHTLLQVFPGAMPASAMHRRICTVMESLGLVPGNTRFGNSTCSDEINNQPGRLIPLLASHWGDTFPMGGIGGAPFVGKTGFGAFSHHVPDNGHVFIVYGPHISISAKGELGKCKRQGQSGSSSACGAVLAAYDQCRNCTPARRFSFLGGGEHGDDMQQAWLRAAINPHVKQIQASKQPLASLVHVAYQAVHEKLRRIVNTDFGPGKLVLIGGIQINMPDPGEDHFLPLSFTVEDSKTPPQDLLPHIAI